MTRKSLLFLSLVLALLSASSRMIAGTFTTNAAWFLLVMTLLGVPWLVILGVSVYKFGRKGYWVLLGAPLALYWPTMFLLTLFGCVIGDANCA